MSDVPDASATGDAIDAHRLPAGACDCHVHVVGDAAEWPMLPTRHYTPGPAPHEALLAHLQRNGLQRVVLVQPSVYGSDNELMLRSLDRLQGAGRGVAVVDEGADAALLARLHARGVRGLRLNVESAGMRDPQALAAALRRWSARVATQPGWHLQVYASHATLASLVEVLATLPVPLVLDHFAMVPGSVPVDDPSLQRLLQRVSAAPPGRVYVKLSAPYRIAAGQPEAAVTRLAQAWVQAAPAQLLWGSDWPHTDREPGKGPLEVSRYRDIAPATLQRQLHDWLPTEALRRQVLVHNPARLYGF